MDGAGSCSLAHRAGLLPTELTGMWGWILLRSPHQGRGSPPAPAPTKQRPVQPPPPPSFFLDQHRPADPLPVQLTLFDFFFCVDLPAATLPRGRPLSTSVAPHLNVKHSGADMGGAPKTMPPPLTLGLGQAMYTFIPKNPKPVRAPGRTNRHTYSTFMASPHHHYRPYLTAFARTRVRHTEKVKKKWAFHTVLARDPHEECLTMVMGPTSACDQVTVDENRAPGNNRDRQFCHTGEGKSSSGQVRRENFAFQFGDEIFPAKNFCAIWGTSCFVHPQ